jgi:hypothetical protein
MDKKKVDGRLVLVDGEETRSSEDLPCIIISPVMLYFQQKYDRKRVYLYVGLVGLYLRNSRIVFVVYSM